MRALFTTVLSLSLSGSAVIAALLALQALLGRRVSWRWRYYVWLIAAARLLLPLGPAEGPVGRLFAVPQTDVPGRYAAAPLPAEGETIQDPEAGPDPAPSGVPSPAPGGTRESTPLWRRAGAALWGCLPGVYLTAALALLGWKIFACRRCLVRLRRGWRPAEEAALLEVLEKAMAAAGVRRRVELMVSPAADTPMLLGLLRRRILLPAAARPGEDLYRSLLHELVHCRRRDIAYKWLVQLAVCLHWFNPLVRRMAREVDRCCELSCDEAVLRLLPAEERRSYGDTLLRAARPAGAGGGLVSAGLSENGKLLKERLNAIMEYRTVTRRTALLSLLLALALAVGALGLGSSGRPAAPSVPPSASMGDPDAPFRYTHQGFYQPPYLFQLGWDLPAGRESGYASAVLTLSDGSRLTVYLGEDCRDIADDPEALAALTALLERLRREEVAFPPARPLLASVEFVGNDNPAALAQKYYQEEQLSGFGAVFSRLSGAEQGSWLDRLYADGSIAFFGAAVSALPASSPQAARLAERAYADGQVSFFSVVAGQCLDETALRRWLSRAEADGEAGFRAVLYDMLGESGGKTAMEAALEAQQRAAYEAAGVTEQNGVRYYQGQRVRILLDMRADSSFSFFTQDPAGTVDIRILRDGAGNVTGAACLTAAEYRALFGDGEAEQEGPWEGEDGAIHIPIAIPALAAGELADLGTYTLSAGDRIRYDVSAAGGTALQVAFSAPGDTALNVVYYSVKNLRQGDELLRCAQDVTVSPTAMPGRCRLFVRAAEGDLRGITGSVTLTPARAAAAERVEPEEAPEAVRRAMARCTPRQWYAIHCDGRQYLYCGGFPGRWAYAPARTEEGWRIEIAELGRQESGDVLLLLGDGAPVSLYCSGRREPVTDLYL